MGNDLFLHEDLSKPENRINVSLFGALLVPAFREWLHARLGLPASAVMYPSTNVVSDAGHVRPDFVVKDAATDATIAWVEVECDRDVEQLQRFRRQLPQRVIAIWGTGAAGADLGLDDIAGFLDAFDITREHPQVRHNLRHLRDLIREGLDGPAARVAKVATVSEAMLETPLVRALREALGARLSFDISRPMRPGEIRAQTFSERGFSLRVYSRIAASRSVSLLSQSGGRHEIAFPSKAKLDHYLADQSGPVTEYAALLAVLGADIARVAREQKVVLPVAIVERHAAQLASAVLAFAGPGAANVTR